LVVIAQVADVCKMLDEPPLWNIEYSCSLEHIVEVANRRGLLRQLDPVVPTHLRKVPLKNASCHGASSAYEPVPNELLRRIELRVKEIRLHQLADIEQRTLET